MDTLKLKMKPCMILCCQSRIHPKHGPSQTRKIHYLKLNQGGLVNAKDTVVGCASLVQSLSRKSMSRLEMKSVELLPDDSELSALMICCADNGLFSQAQQIWEVLLNSSFVPSIQILSNLMDAYGRMGLFEEIIKILDQVTSRNFNLLPQAYSHAISCFGKHGQLQLMENTLKRMVSRGFPVDSAAGNAFIKYYSTFGSLSEMQTAYRFLKRSRHLINEGGIRAVAFAYLKERKFYKLGVFLRDVGLGRKDVGNLLWNYLLLSYAANFKMKSLQREFLSMMEAGFHPNLTTFNIRAVAFSRMSLFWDLHLSVEHMKHENIVPDLVTYGCFVDAYLDKRLGRNLDFVFNKMNLDDSPLVLTDPLMFEVLGKGDFHSSSEAFLEFRRGKKWTYRDLISLYLKKQLRRNQIFWNY